jgi:hypothetical protein
MRSNLVKQNIEKKVEVMPMESKIIVPQFFSCAPARPMAAAMMPFAKAVSPRRTKMSRV